MDSDESDFYGDDDVVNKLEQRVADFDVDSWWQERESVKAVSSEPKVSGRTQGVFQLHNPYEGAVSCARQLRETVDAFLERLPPLTTDLSPITPWIYIANPYLPGTVDLDGLGNDRDVPVDRDTNIERFKKEGMETLHVFREYEESATSRPGSSHSRASFAVVRRRRTVSNQLLDLAHKYRVTTGKWMLFCDSISVNSVWETIARETAKNELGSAAKVQPRGEASSLRTQRLICIYTSDFRDKKDVKRVLHKLRKLGLAERTFGTIYYKPDAFTHIGIARGNPWGIKASLYSSTKM